MPLTVPRCDSHTRITLCITGYLPSWRLQLQFGAAQMSHVFWPDMATAAASASATVIPPSTHLCAAPDKARQSSRVSPSLSLSLCQPLSLSFFISVLLFIPRFNQKRKFRLFCYAEVVHFVRAREASMRGKFSEVTHRMLLLLLYLSLALSAVGRIIRCENHSAAAAAAVATACCIKLQFNLG